MGKHEKTPAWQLIEVRNKKEVICGNQTTLHHKNTGNRHDHVYDKTSTRNHVRKSWRFGTSPTLSWWRYHTGGSRSLPTVHPSPCEGRLWVARRSVTTDNQDATTDEPKNLHGTMKSHMIAEARNEGRTVHFASITNLCHLKSSELEQKIESFKSRVVLRGV